MAMPAAGNQAAVRAFGGRLRVGVEPLRVPLAGKGQQLGLGQRVWPRLNDLPDKEFFEFHSLKINAVKRQVPN
jgi:hypothetical protein